jgi:hypothetical protein
VMFKAYTRHLQWFLQHRVSCLGHFIVGIAGLASLAQVFFLGLDFFLRCFLALLSVYVTSSTKITEPLINWLIAFDDQCFFLRQHRLLIPYIFVCCILFVLVRAFKTYFSSSHYRLLTVSMIGCLCVFQVVRVLNTNNFIGKPSGFLGPALLQPYIDYIIAILLITWLIDTFNGLQYPSIKKAIFKKKVKKNPTSTSTLYETMLFLAFSTFISLLPLLIILLPLTEPQIEQVAGSLGFVIDLTLMGISISTLFVFYGRMPQRKFSLFKVLIKLYGFIWKDFQFKPTLKAHEAYAKAFATSQHQNQTLFWLVTFAVSIPTAVATYSLLQTHLPYWQVLMYTMAGKALLFSLVLRVINQRLQTPIVFKDWVPWLILGFFTSHTLPTIVNTFKFLDTCVFKLLGLHDIVVSVLSPFLASPFMASIYAWGQTLGVGITVDLLAFGGLLWCFWYRDMCYLAEVSPER